jgi:hypothetical protein
MRQCMAKGVAVTVARKGEAMGGTVMVKIVLGRAEGCKLLSQSRDENGVMGWMAAFEGEVVPETKADEYIARGVKRDPDLWVIEVEDKSGANPFEGKIF